MMLRKSRFVVAALSAVSLAAAQVARAEPAGAVPSALRAEPPAARAEGAAVNWIDHFDTYATGSQMHGQGGWEGWNGAPAAGALTTDLFARSLLNSVEISPTTDLAHPYTGYTTGVWTFTSHVYIPTGTTGILYFILLNTYPNPTLFGHWSMQYCFDTVADVVRDDTNGVCDGATTLPLIYDQWVEIRVVIDLDSDQQSAYYGGQLLFQGPWSTHLGPDGVLNIAAVDLYAHPPSVPTAVYFDDISLSNLPFLDGFETEDTENWHFTLP